MIGLLFPVLVNLIGISGSYFIFVVLGVGGLLFLSAYMPETKGKSLEQLEDEFKSGDPAV
ncbi:MFS transporter [Pseudarthrobacter sp. PvP022]|uniref:MFS transporter n=1 Tax=Pseudarthrobacter sp. PvP022 TaxID=3156433 RepID=UPI0024759CF8